MSILLLFCQPPHVAELVAHRDCVSRHAKGVVAAVKEQKGLVQTLHEGLQEEVTVDPTHQTLE